MALLGALVGIPAPLDAQVVRLTQEEALRLAFPPPAVVERRTAFLTEERQAAARERAGAGVPVEQGVVTYYVGTHQGRPVGAAYFDAHRVRTLAEVLMIVVDTADRVSRIEVLRFDEPPDYRPPSGWLGQVVGRPLSDDLSLKSDLATLTGATLTAHAVVRAVRRVLALHATLDPLRGGAR